MGERLARRVRLCALVAAVFLAGCGGGGGDEAPAAAGPPTVGADGGTVSAEGVKLGAQRDRVEQILQHASRRPNGTAVRTAARAAGMHALSADGAVLAFVADRFDMTGDAGDAQIYVAPRR